jgi:hypothetical protein
MGQNYPEILSLTMFSSLSNNLELLMSQDALLFVDLHNSMHYESTNTRQPTHLASKLGGLRAPPMLHQNNNQ